MRRSVAVVCIGMVLSTTQALSSSLFSEDFGSLAGGTPVTVENTSFTYARAGTGTGAELVAKNPGSFSGASARMLATSTSLTGLGVTNSTYAPFQVGTLAFSFRTPDSFSVANDLYAFIGTGNTFSGNSLFNGNDLLAGFTVAAGQFRTRNSLNAWEDVGAALLADSLYDLQIVFNGSGTAVGYGSDSVAGGTADIWLNGALFGDDVSIRNATGATAFRFYTTGSIGATAFELDNIRFYNSAVTVPEPGVWALAGLSGLLGIGARIRRA